MKYKEAGVDIDYADALKTKIKKFLQNISKERFAGLIKIEKDKYLSATIDGVGTKVILAREAGYLEGVGVDIVNHCVNDLLCSGARPLFFLDYIASSNLKEVDTLQIVKGINRALRDNDAFLLGGETAEMPDVYKSGNFDLVGCMVGIAGRKEILPKRLKPGDLLYGLASSGLHTNGYSLVRKILKNNRINLDSKLKGKKLKNILLKPHKSYYKLVYPLIKKNYIKALVHITGGGFEGNLKRVLSENLCAEIDFKDFKFPEIFKFIKEKGNVEWEEMFRVFNMGIGIIMIVDKKDKIKINNYFKRKKEPCYFLGKIKKCREKFVKINF